MSGTNYDQAEERKAGAYSAGESFSVDEDMLMEQILENINTTSIGQVLKKIASLPEVRRDKILDVRQRLTTGDYDFNGRLEAALDKVLEDLTAEFQKNSPVRGPGRSVRFHVRSAT